MILSYYFQDMIANINVRQFSTAIVRFAKKQKSEFFFNVIDYIIYF